MAYKPKAFCLPLQERSAQFAERPAEIAGSILPPRTR
jgi:hypothetical protein